MNTFVFAFSAKRDQCLVCLKKLSAKNMFVLYTFKMFFFPYML